MIQEREGLFELTTKNTGYLFRVMETGHLEHLYYGRRVKVADGAPLEEKHAFAPGNTNAYDRAHPRLSLEDVCLEMSSYGKGDIREPFVEVIHGDGSTTSDFLYDSYEVLEGGEVKEEYSLPGSYSGNGPQEHLCVTLRDQEYHLKLELHYRVFPECDVITRSARLVNESRETVQLARLMSLQLDLQEAAPVFTTFTGAWGREMKRTDTALHGGRLVNSSYTGTSSSRANPFVMLSHRDTNEDAGDCYGFNLIYSGNHYESLEVTPYGKTRLVTGMNPQSFLWTLEPGEGFDAPEAVMAYSHQGFNGMSCAMHAFVREHIVRGEWKYRERPVLLNSWEAAYFDIDEEKLVELAKAGKEVGIELFVMDDGWFGSRNDDTQSLGDWQVNKEKLPGGLKGLADKIKALGMDFGIWVEPEMVNEKSRLYEAHPEWVLRIPGKPHSEGRNQMILDLANPQVQDYVIGAMTQVFFSADISYVKWDMNRTFTDLFSQSLPPKRQGELTHRYYLGLYRCMRVLTERFPKILFEGCSAGGNRFDLGILCYFPQIWASDNTDALCRAEIQNGYSYGYPPSTVSAHVSACPNHQTFRTTPLETRFHVAAFGIFGYECNLREMEKQELAEVAAQVALYKQWRGTLQFGTFLRGRSFAGEGGADFHSCLRHGEGNVMEWTCVSPDRSRAVGMLMQRLVVPNTQYECYRAKGLDPEKCYHFYNKQDVLVHCPAAESAEPDGEAEDCRGYGDLLMYHGVKLKQAFGGRGRHFQDFGSRLFFMEEE